ncbi:hypothetical protein QJS10_CPA05g00520 [Acorus calamus]|uniref:CASP-like protein n=1 Tax=Acorus calamus TaxID=4465 RepID=A0AAV9EWV0_ACOCL|nr:hypothetical protein QJS10_CPA05g00520 [Acorus calamus]
MDMESDVKVAIDRSSLRLSDLLLRLVALVTTLVAAVVMGTAVETKTVPITVVPTLPPLPVALTAKWHYLSAFTYFIATHVIACSYLAFSLVLLIANRASKAKSLAFALAVTDVIVMGLMFTGNSATIAVGLIGFERNSHVGWNKVCNVYKGYCNHIDAAALMSLIGSIVVVLIIVLTIANLHKQCGSM